MEVMPEQVAKLEAKWQVHVHAWVWVCSCARVCVCVALCVLPGVYGLTVWTVQFVRSERLRNFDGERPLLKYQTLRKMRTFSGR